MEVGLVIVSESCPLIGSFNLQLLFSVQGEDGGRAWTGPGQTSTALSVSESRDSFSSGFSSS